MVLPLLGELAIPGPSTQLGLAPAQPLAAAADQLARLTKQADRPIEGPRYTSSIDAAYVMPSSSLWYKRTPTVSATRSAMSNSG